jgi:hypothetical protein
MMTGDYDHLVRTIRTTPLPDLATLARRIDELRQALDSHGRDVESFDIAVTGICPMLDIRDAWSTEQLVDTVGLLNDLGATWVVIAVCGDDPSASVETVERFAADIIDATADRQGDSCEPH